MHAVQDHLLYPLAHGFCRKVRDIALGILIHRIEPGLAAHGSRVIQPGPFCALVVHRCLQFCRSYQRVLEGIDSADGGDPGGFHLRSHLAEIHRRGGLGTQLRSLRQRALIGQVALVVLEIKEDGIDPIGSTGLDKLAALSAVQQNGFRHIHPMQLDGFHRFRLGLGGFGFALLPAAEQP